MDGDGQFACTLEIDVVVTRTSQSDVLNALAFQNFEARSVEGVIDKHAYGLSTCGACRRGGTQTKIVEAENEFVARG